MGAAAAEPYEAAGRVTAGEVVAKGAFDERGERFRRKRTQLKMVPRGGIEPPTRGFSVPERCGRVRLDATILGVYGCLQRRSTVPGRTVPDAKWGKIGANRREPAPSGRAPFPRTESDDREPIEGAQIGPAALGVTLWLTEPAPEYVRRSVR